MADKPIENEQEDLPKVQPRPYREAEFDVRTNLPDPVPIWSDIEYMHRRLQFYDTELKEAKRKINSINALLGMAIVGALVYFIVERKFK